MTAHSRGPINVDTCPFCGETDFDAIGLKGHLTQEDCEEYRSIVPPPRPFATPRAATVEQATRAEAEGGEGIPYRMTSKFDHETRVTEGVIATPPASPAEPTFADKLRQRGYQEIPDRPHLGREVSAPGDAVREVAPPNSLPNWSECSLRVGNSKYLEERKDSGGYGPEYDSKTATELHRFIYEYDDADRYRSAWFMHRLERLIEEVRADTLATLSSAKSAGAQEPFSIEMAAANLRALVNTLQDVRVGVITAANENINLLYAAASAKAQWQPIETAPKDNKIPLLLARFNDDGSLQSIDYNGIWESDRESWEIPERYWYWASAHGNVEEPSHWMYQPEWYAHLPAAASEQRGGADES